MATFSLSIDRTSLSLPPLVLHGDRQAGWCLMPGWQMPGQQARIAYAASPYLHGDVATDWTWQQGVMSGDVLPVAEDRADLDAIVSELRTALGRLSYDVTVEWNGVSETWRCDPGSMSPSSLTWISIGRNEPVYSLSIPCYPLGVS